MAFALTWLANFTGLLASVALFFLPFVAVFTWRNRVAIRESRPHFNYFMERFFMSSESNALVFAWAAAEAVAWYVIPEFLLVLVVFMRVHRKIDLIKYDMLGTVAGTLLAWYWRLPQQTFLQLPYVRPRMLAQVGAWYSRHGILGLLYQPFSGVPYKVFIHQAAAAHFFFIWFILLAVAARMVRYVVAYEATKALYPLTHRFVQKHYAVLFVCAIAVFTFLLLHVVALYT
jgi:hypothetical protein